MWPWGHAAVGYLLYSLGLRQQDRRPDSPEVFLLVVGTQLPDLVDKPLAWDLGLLASGRSLGHSVLVAVVVLALLYVVAAPHIGRSRVTAFGVGYLSHPLADFPYDDVLAGDFSTTAYLVWPLRSMPPDDFEQTVFQFLLSFDPGPFDYVQLGLVVLAIGRWYADGCPGWDAVKTAVRTGEEPPARR